MPQTLDFVRDCGERWGVHIEWLEYQAAERSSDRWTAVTYKNASRNVEPFAALIDRKKHLPNPVMRFCTQQLKIIPMERFAAHQGWGDDYDIVLGLRADEPSRVVKMRSANRIVPLAVAGISKRDVIAFWQAQNFDLALPTVNGTTPTGNCDLCYLKGAETIQGMMRLNQSLADWWINQERKIGATFRSDRPSYASMLDAVQRQHSFDFGDNDQLIDCFCGDGA